MREAADFLAETMALDGVVRGLPDLDAPTGFKGWTVAQILQHLHYFNRMAVLSLEAPNTFRDEYANFSNGLAADGTMLTITDRLLGGLSGAALRDAWVETAGTTAAAFRHVDPKQRVPWAGPDMSARSAITARLMETWAHGQAIWDLAGLARTDEDRIRSIAHLGVATYAWTFVNRGEAVPEPMPYVRLIGPSGAVWEWGAPREDERIDGPATDFCQVVAQTRNIADVTLKVTGQTAARWMAQAQCFAGPPEQAPAPGTRGPTPNR